MCKSTRESGRTEGALSGVWTLAQGKSLSNNGAGVDRQLAGQRCNENDQMGGKGCGPQLGEKTSMTARIYLNLFALAVNVLAAGIFATLARQRDNALLWTAAGLMGLTGLLILCTITIELRRKPPPSGDSKDG
jgi:hypothetical protein